MIGGGNRNTGSGPTNIERPNLGLPQHLDDDQNIVIGGGRKGGKPNYKPKELE